MNKPYVPDGYPRVTPYLTVKDAPRLLDFLVQVFDAELIDKTERSDGKLAHAAVRIGDSIIELAEATDRFGPTPAAIHIYVPDVDRTHSVALKLGGVAVYEPTEMEYGERASAIQDPVGNQWYIATYRRV
jgi:PhnB protein